MYGGMILHTEYRNKVTHAAVYPCMKLLWLIVAAAIVGAAQDATEWQQARAAGRNAFEQGRYREAEPLLTKALVISQQIGTGDPHVVQSLHDLGDVHRAMGRHAQAEELLRAALIIREQQSGASDPTLAPDVDALAWAIYSQGRLADASMLFRRTVECWNQPVVWL